ncbi:MAG: hypothetical protein HY075_16140 [Deltaproteobacteria bacterium]|nr:hypothetical protein [Deltaproteobacteria bacterium]
MTHDEIVEQITEVAEKPALAIPLVLIGYVAAVGGIVTGFGVLCAWACHR